MSDPTVLLETERGLAPQLIENEEGWRGVRNYRVSTHEEAAAMLMPGVPQIGDKWSEDMPNLLLVSRASEYAFGTNLAATNVGGWQRIRCDYSTPNTRGRLPVPVENYSYTDFAPTVDTITQLYPLDSEGVEGVSYIDPIAGGAGASVKKTRHTAEVHQFKAINCELEIRALLLLENNVNGNRVSLPPIRGRTDRIVFDKGECLYVAFRLNPVGNLLEIIHEIDLAEDFLVRYQNEAQDGTAIGSRITVPVYPVVDFPEFP